MAQTTIGRVTEETVRHLAELPAAGRVISLFLDLDPERFSTPAARRTQLESLLDAVQRQSERQEMTHDERTALDEDIRRIRALFEEGEPTFDVDGARALAIFVGGGGALFEVYKLPGAVAPRARVDATPYVTPLSEILAPDRWLTLLLNRKNARLFRGVGGRLSEVHRREDEDMVHWQHQAGGWSQKRFERSVEESVDDHLAMVAQDLYGILQAAPFDRLVIACTEELFPRMLETLHPDVRRLSPVRVDCDVEHSTVEDVRRVLDPVVEETERREERELLDRLAEQRARDGRSAVGLADVLRALNERTVMALLFDRRYAAPGGRCPRCGLLTTEGAPRCPIDETPLEREDNVVDAAVEAASKQDAAVRAVRRHDDLRDEGIAALLRF